MEGIQFGSEMVAPVEIEDTGWHRSWKLEGSDRVANLGEPRSNGHLWRTDNVVSRGSSVAMAATDVRTMSNCKDRQRATNGNEGLFLFTSSAVLNRTC